MSEEKKNAPAPELVPVTVHLHPEIVNWLDHFTSDVKAREQVALMAIHNAYFRDRLLRLCLDLGLGPVDANKLLSPFFMLGLKDFTAILSDLYSTANNQNRAYYSDLFSGFPDPFYVE